MNGHRARNDLSRDQCLRQSPGSARRTGHSLLPHTAMMRLSVPPALRMSSGPAAAANFITNEAGEVAKQLPRSRRQGLCGAWRRASGGLWGRHAWSAVSHLHKFLRSIRPPRLVRLIASKAKVCKQRAAVAFPILGAMVSFRRSSRARLLRSIAS